jgi:hypothetical protein
MQHDYWAVANGMVRLLILPIGLMAMGFVSWAYGKVRGRR